MRPTPSTPRFGIREIRDETYEQAQAYFEAGIALAKAGDGKLAEEKLNQAVATHKHNLLHFETAKAFAQGVPPGLNPNADRADEILQGILNTKDYSLSYSHPSYQSIADLYRTQLVPKSPKFHAKAVALYKKTAEGANLFGILNAALNLAKMGEFAPAKTLLTDYWNRLTQYAGNEQERFNIAKVFAGLYEDPNSHASSQKPQQDKPDFKLLQDESLANQYLKELANTHPTRLSKATKQEMLQIFASGQGVVKQDKTFAKEIIDKLF